jgi:hypothetical protein
MKTEYENTKGVAYRVSYPKGRSNVYQKENLGSIELPAEIFADDGENAVRAAFPKANAFRLYGVDGSVWFCGTL